MGGPTIKVAYSSLSEGRDPPVTVQTHANEQKQDDFVFETAK